MKDFIATAITGASVAALFIAAPLLADDESEAADRDATTKADTPVIVEKNKQGKATKVRIDGETVDVCMNEKQDNCINPRAAGLNFGDRPLDYWPGQPASSR